MIDRKVLLNEKMLLINQDSFFSLATILSFHDFIIFAALCTFAISTRLKLGYQTNYVL